MVIVKAVYRVVVGTGQYVVAQVEHECQVGKRYVHIALADSFEHRHPVVLKQIVQSHFIPPCGLACRERHRLGGEQ